ncbi:ATP-binding cassette domain-containing protein [Meridianimarinicoccus roseus]
MSDKDDTERVHLRVDRLAAAMDAARARARGEVPAPAPGNVGEIPASQPSLPEASDESPAPPNPTAPAAPFGNEDSGAPAMEKPAPGIGPAGSSYPHEPEPAWPVPTQPDSAQPDCQPQLSADADLSGQADPPGDAPQADVSAASVPQDGTVPDPMPGDAAPLEPLPDATAGPVPAEASHSPDPGSDPRTEPLILTPDFTAPPPRPSLDPLDDRTRADFPAAGPIGAAAAVPHPAVPPAPRPAGPVLLSLEGVRTDIGRYHILGDVGFDVPTGAVTMLLGRNGVGKTTTLRTIMGLWRARSGEIRFAGNRIERWPTHRIARAGVGYVPESMAIFGDLTVAENVALGSVSKRVPTDRLDWLFSLFPPLATFWRAPAGNLSGGQKQMLALARALVQKRRLYLIDEPTKGLAPTVVDTVVAALRDLKLQGATVLMVEQNFAVARALGDRCVVMDDGRVTWSGVMADLAQDAALQTRLMGLSLGVDA